MAELCRRNAESNGFSERVQVVHSDIRNLIPQAPKFYDGVIFNPPYQRLGEGRSAKNPVIDKARREVVGQLDDFVRVALEQLTHDGHAHTILPMRRHQELVEVIEAQQGGLVRRRVICARENVTPRYFLATFGRQESLSHEEPPLVVHEGSGFAPEVAGWLGEVSSEA